ncbi:type II toxin-antitoxin system Phd/YefM family antitoxin [Rhodopila globiformis]|uniref:Antitoxin n=1 Tax=Rhodopila globiformis TaxID=1071 RepID=A0A2S6NP09_RHOGL|nr:type II toxin-antitoxin system prevent-host-death family antitoxin [Rhodopila globiformis]PPQ39503.1 prevent-host-death protein [Rhodopila globiformis]
MRTVNIHEAKTHFSQLVEAAANGETVIIARAGKPLARLTALEQPAAGGQRRLGFMRGQVTVPDDFDTLGAAEIAAMFHGESS